MTEKAAFDKTRIRTVVLVGRQDFGRCPLTARLPVALWPIAGKPALHDGRWGMATLEVCLAMLDSARENRDIALHHQVPAPAVRCS